MHTCGLCSKKHSPCTADTPARLVPSTAAKAISPPALLCGAPSPVGSFLSAPPAAGDCGSCSGKFLLACSSSAELFCPLSPPAVSSLMPLLLLPQMAGYSGARIGLERCPSWLDAAPWLNSIPRGAFSWIPNECLSAGLQKQTGCRWEIGCKTDVKLFSGSIRGG